MKLQLDQHYQLRKGPHTLTKILETLPLDNNEIYVRYKQEDKEEDWKIISEEDISTIFEPFVDKDLLDMVTIEKELPKANKDILALTEEGNKGHYYRCGHVPGCMTWKCSITGSTAMINVIKWKYINNA